MSKEIYVLVPVKILLNNDDEVLGLAEPVSLEDCERSYRECGFYSIKDSVLDQLKDLCALDAKKYLASL